MGTQRGFLSRLVLLSVILYTNVLFPQSPGDVVINEVVTDPQQDWSTNDFNGYPFISTVSNGVDEWIELYIKTDGLDLTDWTIELLDGTDVIDDLTDDGAFQSSIYISNSPGSSFSNTAIGDYLVLGNVKGSHSMNNNILIVLKDNSGNIIDQVELGNDGAPDGNASNIYDESISRFPNGTDTDNDVNDFVQKIATMGRDNNNTPVAGSGNALSFDGDNDFIFSDETDKLNALPLTLEAWVKPVLRSEGDIFYPNNVISNDTSGRHGHGLGVNVWDGGSSIVVEYQDGFVETEVEFTSGTWYHVAVVYIEGNVKAYVNGNLVSDFSFTQGALDGQNIIFIGNYNEDAGTYGSERFFKGEIDEVRVWNTARTEAEIKENMFVPLSADEENLQCYWRFDDGSGETVMDVCEDVVHCIFNENGSMAWTESEAWKYRTIDEDNSLTINPAGYDPDGHAITTSQSSAPAHGSLSFGSVTYNPDADYNGNDNFTYTISDGISNDNYSVTVTINPTPDNPTGADNSITTNEDVNYTFRVNDFNFSDPDGDSFAGIKIISVETAGDLEYNNADVAANTLCPDVTQLVFKPNPGESGSPYSTFTFKVKDNSGALSSASYTMRINVNSVNDSPVLTDIEDTDLIYTENDPLVSITNSIVVNDPDDVNIESALIQITENYQQGEDVLNFENQNGITGNWNETEGKMTLTGTASTVNYQAALRSVKYQNIDSNPTTLTRTISFTISDGDSDSNTETRNIIINSENNAPVLSDIENNNLEYTENDSPKQISNSVVVTDADNGNLKSAIVQVIENYISGEDALSFTDTDGITGNWDASAGKFTLAGTATVENYQTALRNVKYYNSSDNPSTSERTITFTVNDGNENSNTVERKITVITVNDPPVITEISDVLLRKTGTEELIITASDAEDDSLLYSVTGGNDSLVVNLNANIIYITPDSLYRGRTDLEVTVSDGELIDTSEFVVEVNIPQINSEAETNGAISPDGLAAVDYGDSITFTITPDTGYHIQNVVVDDSSVGTLQTYSFNNVTEDHTIAAIFGIRVFTIEASANGHGVVVPSGNIEKEFGSNQQFRFIPGEGFQLADVVIDGVSSGPLESFTFNDISSNHTVEGIFVNLELLSPNGNERFERGDVVSVRWLADNIENINIYYSTNNGDTWCEVLSGYPADSNMYNWTITDISSDSCRIKISSSNWSWINDKSEEMFSVVSLRLLSPNGGEALKAGEKYSITWLSGRKRALKIFYSINNGENWIQVFSVSGKSEGNTEWLVPNTPSQQCLIKIVDLKDNTRYDFSDSVFEIKPDNSVPVLLYPQNDSEQSFISIIFRWNGKGESYILQAAKDSSFSHPVIDQNKIKDNNYSATSFESSTEYFWRVKSVKGNFTSSWSSTGRFKTKAGNKLSGKIKYFNPTSSGVNNINISLIHLSGKNTCSVSTADSGYFDLGKVECGKYQLRTNCSGLQGKGITSADALMVFKYYLGLDSLCALQKLAADINNDGKINLTDSQLIMEHYTNPATCFPNNKPVMVFSSSENHNDYNCDFARSSLECDTLNITCETYLDICGLFSGDVNCSYESDELAKKNYSPADNSNVQKINPGENFTVPVRLNETSVIEALSFKVDYPYELAELISLEVNEKLTGNISGIEAGEIKISWINTNINNEEVEIAEREELLKLHFKPKQKFDESCIFNLSVDEAELICDERNGLNNLMILTPQIVIDVPKEFALMQNYPNPFNASTTILYSLPEGAKVTLHIYNIIGEVVSTLVNSYQEAGRYEIEWNADDFTSGIYFYRIQAGNFSEIRKLILLK